MRSLGIIAGGIGVGVLSGLLGIGGGIVLVPLLLFLFHHTQKRAQATSLVAITLTSAAGAITYGTAGDVQLLPASLIVAGGVLGTFLGAEIAHRMSERQLQLIFAGLLLAAALRMGLAPAVSGGAGLAELGVWVGLGYAGVGLLMGLLATLIGVAGGFVVVPLLVLAFGFTSHEAQGTSLAVMVPVALLGASRHARNGYTDWRAGVLLGAGGILGAPVGAMLALAIPADILQRIFAVVLVVLIVRLLGRARRQRP